MEDRSLYNLMVMVMIEPSGTIPRSKMPHHDYDLADDDDDQLVVEVLSWNHPEIPR